MNGVQMACALEMLERVIGRHMEIRTLRGRGGPLLYLVHLRIQPHVNIHLEVEASDIPADQALP